MSTATTKLRATIESPKFKEHIGVAASASSAEVAAAIKDPRVGTNYQAQLRAMAIAQGAQAGAIAPGREEAWAASYDSRPEETVASLATAARTVASREVTATAEAAIGENTDPRRALRCYAEATQATSKAAVPVAAAAPAVAPAPEALLLAASRERMGHSTPSAPAAATAAVPVVASSPAQSRWPAGAAAAPTAATPGFPRATAAGRKLEIEHGRLLYGDGQARSVGRLTADGQAQVFGWDGWVNVEAFEALGGTLTDSVAALRTAQQAPSGRLGVALTEDPS